MKHNLLFNDMTMIDQSFTEGVKTDAKHLLESSNNPRLKVVIDATHSGVLTNLRVYPAIKVAKGHKSFFSKDKGGSAEYDKPVLTHHDDFTDPVGRVVNASFSPIKSGDLYTRDYMNPDKEGKGSGVVTVETIISDPDAIQKILDGRYLTVSAGHSTDKMLCSICSDSIFSCDHYPGFYYNDEGEEVDINEELNIDAHYCYGITNNMDYREVSFVNAPAQPSAKLVEFNWEDAKNNDSAKETGNKALFSLTKAKKSSLRDYSLTDDNLELSLLTGKDKSTKRKTSIHIPPSIANRLQEAIEVDNSDESQNDHIEDSRKQGAEKSEETNTDNTNKEVKGNTDMENDAKIDPKEFEDLKKNKDALATDLEQQKKTVEELNSTVESKDNEIKELRDNISTLQDELKSHFADTLLTYKVRLGKPGATDIDSDEKRKEYLDSLKKRTIESLKDAIVDLTPEIEALDQGNEDETSATDIVAGDKVEPSTMNTDRGGNTESHEDDLDKLFS